MKPLPEWAVTGVMLSDDLLPKILALLPARKSQPLVCHAWSRLRRLVLPSQLGREQSAAVLCSALRAYYLQREIADACCRALFGVGATTEGANSIRSQLLADAGAPQMVVTMIRDHGDCVPVQAASYGALGWLCAGQSGPDEEGRLRRDTIMGAGALPLIIAGMRAHPSHAAVQQTGCHALSALARGQVQTIVEAMAAAGALAAVVACRSTATVPGSKRTAASRWEPFAARGTWGEMFSAWMSQSARRPPLRARWRRWSTP